MSIIIYNNPQSDTWRGRYTTFNHGHLEGIVLNCISLSSLLLFTSPLMFCPSPFLVCLCIYLSLFSFTLSLSLSLLPCVPLILLVCLPLALQLKLDSWIDHNGSSKLKYEIVKMRSSLCYTWAYVSPNSSKWRIKV